MSDQIKVLVVDDSSLVRKIITDIIESDPMIKVIGTANNGKTAIYRNNELNPDVITMDIEMPILDGLSALDTIIKTNPKPVIMLSVLTQYGAEATFRALDIGAVDFVPKPSSILSLSVDEIGELLISKIKSVYRLKIRFKGKGENKAGYDFAGRSFETGSMSSKVVGIGTSTGGPSALMKVFREFPRNFPSPVLVVQHMPEGFTRAFSERLNDNSHLTVKEAENNEDVIPGYGYIAPGNSHILIEKKNGGCKIKLYKGEKKSGHRPSIDVLFNSLADYAGSETVGVIMTGMGKDGAEGIMKIKSRGGYTIAQDEKTSVVYGMNRVAVENGAIDDVVPVHEIAHRIIEHV